MTDILYGNPSQKGDYCKWEFEFNGTWICQECGLVDEGITICPSCDGTQMNLYDATNHDCEYCNGRGYING